MNSAVVDERPARMQLRQVGGASVSWVLYIISSLALGVLWDWSLRLVSLTKDTLERLDGPDGARERVITCTSFVVTTALVSIAFRRPIEKVRPFLLLVLAAALIPLGAVLFVWIRPAVGAMYGSPAWVGGYPPQNLRDLVDYGIVSLLFGFFAAYAGFLTGPIALLCVFLLRFVSRITRVLEANCSAA